MLTPFPNSALTHFNATTLSNTVTAFHDILEGEEITISCRSLFYSPRLSHHPFLITILPTSLWLALCSFLPLSPSPSRNTNHLTCNSDSPFGLPSTTRQKLLLAKWGFTCTCTLCSSPPSVLAASDERRNTIEALGKEVVKLVERGETKALKRAAQLYGEVVEAVRLEGLVPHLGGHYDVLGRLWAAAGELEKGKRWLLEGRREEEGFESAGGSGTV
jgi:hypothetical protein